MTVVVAPVQAGARASWVAGWRSFWREPDALLWPALLAAAAWVLTWVLSWLVLGASPLEDVRVRTAVGFVVLLVLGQLFWLVLVRVGLRARHLPVHRTGAAVATAVAIGLLVSLGFLFGVVGPVVVAVLTQFALVGVLRDGLGVLAALRASVLLCLRRPVRVLGFTALALLTLLGGLLLGVVGVVPAAAIVLLGQLDLHPGSSR